ncbi:MAG: hypothetical protein EOP04_19455 [Proteobacteria bacterium]|nr:MAG: hypothetical protein EOP04_19455 [Pseudomonadota bacterium]
MNFLFVFLNSSFASHHNYDPNAKPKETKPAETKAKETKSETKSDDSKKGADNPPKHEEEKTVEVEIEHHEIGKWTGVDKPRNPDDTMIATPMEKSETEKSPLDRCVDDETNLLIRQVGSQTLDPNGSLNQKEIEEVEKSQSLFGYCDVIVMGQEFCRMKKFKEDSVPSGTDLGIEKFEKAAGALDALKMWGQCDKAVLGAKFCKDYEHQWIITPTGFEKIEHETSVKSGDIRRFAPQPDFEVKDEPVRDFTINPNFN